MARKMNAMVRQMFAPTSCQYSSKVTPRTMPIPRKINARIEIIPSLEYNRIYIIVGPISNFLELRIEIVVEIEGIIT